MEKSRIKVDIENKKKNNIWMLGCTFRKPSDQELLSKGTLRERVLGTVVVGENDMS